MANVCDDHDMGTTHVIRGEEWLPSTGLHILLYEAFGWTPPQFAHLPLILNPDGRGKLSKRKAYKLGIPVFPFSGMGEDESGNVVQFKGFKDEGFLPEAVLNFLLFLGWSPASNKEIMTKEEMIADFSLDRVNKAGARFDYAKAKWFNSQHLQKMSDSSLAEHLNEQLKSKGLNFDIDYITQVVSLIKDRVELLPDLFEQSSMFFIDPTTYDDKIKKNLNPEAMLKLLEFLKSTDDFNAVKLESDIKDWIKENNFQNGQIFVPLRIILVGTNKGPALFNILETLGKEKVIERLENGLKYFKILNEVNV